MYNGIDVEQSNDVSTAILVYRFNFFGFSSGIFSAEKERNSCIQSTAVSSSEQQ